MNKLKKLLKDIAKDPGAYIQLFIMLAFVAGAIYLIVTSNGGIFHSGMWRELYCQNNPLNCIQKGW